MLISRFESREALSIDRGLGGVARTIAEGDQRGELNRGHKGAL
jgi:hypothetical protein